MLSKLINSARNIFNPTRQHKKEEQQQSNVSTTFEQDMVITRGQRGKHASDDDVEDSIVVETPKSSRKRQRTSQDAEVLVISDDEEAETRVAKKPKILPVRAKDEEALQKSQPVVEIPSSQAKPISIGRIEDKSKQTQKAKDKVAEVQDSNASQSDSEEDDDAVEELEHSRKSDAPSPEKSRRSNKENLDSSPSKLPTPTKPQHKRFASEEHEPEFFSTALEKPESEEEESEDEDEAPEVVGAEEAIKSTKLKEREAQKVVEEQEAAIRQKWRERDAALKKQADLAVKKRKKEEDRKLTAADETDAKPLASIEGESDSVADDKNTAQHDDVKPAKPSKIVFDSTNLPEFLPEEYLQDDSDSEASPLASEQPAKRIQKAKFAGIVEKKPKDRRKGSTIYRVAETSSRKLAPKASLGARNMKQDWLQGRSGSGIGASRKAFNTGFFKK